MLKSRSVLECSSPLELSPERLMREPLRQEMPPALAGSLRDAYR
jgi:hypothetical protein